MEKLEEKLSQMKTSEEVFKDFKEVAINRLSQNIIPCNENEMQLYGKYFMKLDQVPLWDVITPWYFNEEVKKESERLELSSKIDRIIYGCGCSSGGSGALKYPMKALLIGDKRELRYGFDPVLSSVYPAGLTAFAEPIILNMFKKVFVGTCEWNEHYTTMYSNFLCGRLINKHPDLYSALAKSGLAHNFERFERDWYSYRIKPSVSELVREKMTEKSRESLSK